LPKRIGNLPNGHQRDGASGAAFQGQLLANATTNSPAGALGTSADARERLSQTSIAVSELLRIKNPFL
jgi:hypothetical protein